MIYFNLNFSISVRIFFELFLYRSISRDLFFINQKKNFQNSLNKKRYKLFIKAFGITLCSASNGSKEHIILS